MQINIEKLSSAIEIMKVSPFGPNPLVFAIISPEAGNSVESEESFNNWISTYSIL